MSWRIIYIENSHKVSLYLGNIKIEDGEENYIIPISDINTIIFNNYKMYLTTQLLCKLSQENVCMIICEKNGLPEVMLNPLNGNYATFRNHELQIKLSDMHKGILWQKIIFEKINNQILVLQKNKKSSSVINKLKDFRNEVLLADETNREGLAAKMYFAELFGTCFTREQKSEEPINVSLNYGYSVVRAMLARLVVAKGLIPTLGVFHRNPYNHFNFVDDLMEVYRPLIDEWVYLNMRESFFTREKRLELVKYMSKKIIIDDKNYNIMKSMDIYVDSIVNYFKIGEIETLKIPNIEFLKDE